SCRSVLQAGLRESTRHWRRWTLGGGPASTRSSVPTRSGMPRPRVIANFRPAIRLSRKDWHSYANRAVVCLFRAQAAPRDPAPPAAWPRWGCGGGGERRRTNATEDPDGKTYRYAAHHSVRGFAAL